MTVYDAHEQMQHDSSDTILQRIKVIGPVKRNARIDSDAINKMTAAC